MKKQSLRSVRWDRLHTLERDNKGFGKNLDWNIMRDCSVIVISEHESGKPRRQEVKIPLKVFNAMVDFYHRPQRMFDAAAIKRKYGNGR